MPRSGCPDTYNITSRRRFKCVACYKQFSVTSGTIFASRKLSSTDLLAAIVIFVNGAKGVSALQVTVTPAKAGVSSCDSPHLPSERPQLSLG
jgi:transposase-like protein